MKCKRWYSRARRNYLKKIFQIFLADSKTKVEIELNGYFFLYFYFSFLLTKFSAE